MAWLVAGLVGGLGVLALLAQPAQAAPARYAIDRMPEPGEGPDVAHLRQLQQDLPTDVAQALSRVTRRELIAGTGWAWVQRLAAQPQGEAGEFAVEHCVRLVEVPFEAFGARLPAEDWGRHLARYLGGEVRVLETDEQGRPLAQVERMVLDLTGLGVNCGPINGDMTKQEVILREADRSAVYWRVFSSANGSTQEDFGSVTFARHDAAATLVTFHSAHRVSLWRGVPLSPGFTSLMLKGLFLGHLRQYARVATGGPGRQTCCGCR